MDYRTLSDRQIRLLTILPAPAGASGEAARVHCKVSLRTLPKTEPANGGALPPHYINSGPCVTKPPVEVHVEELRSSVAPDLGEIDRKQRSRRSRAMDKVMEHVFHRPPEHFLLIRPNAIVGFLSGEEQIRVIARSDKRAGMERHFLGDWGGILHSYDDEAGYNVFIGEETHSAPVTGWLAQRDLNPFFRYPERYEDSYRRYLNTVVKQPGSFVAMSYTWGREQAAEIIVDGTQVRVG